MDFFATLPICVIAIEAIGEAHYSSHTQYIWTYGAADFFAVRQAVPKAVH
jgi:hypothetical protein